MKSNLIFVFLVLAPMLLQLFTGESAESRADDRPANPAAVETKPSAPKAPVAQPDPAARTAPKPTAGGSTEPACPHRLPAQDAVTFM